jgi:hypothetical protein
VPKRIFWIIPNLMTANDWPENQGPLTPRQKYNIAWHQFFDVSAHFGNVVQASISQARMDCRTTDRAGAHSGSACWRRKVTRSRAVC